MFRFLVIDDDPAVRRLLKQYLSPYGQCDVAHDGHEGTGIFRVAADSGSPYDLATVDIEMPVRNGHETLEGIRQIERERGVLLGDDGVKVIIVTGVKDGSHCIKAFREGCECYVTKPFDKEEFLEKVNSLLGGRLSLRRSDDSRTEAADASVVG